MVGFLFCLGIDAQYGRSISFSAKTDHLVARFTEAKELKPGSVACTVPKYILKLVSPLCMSRGCNKSRIHWTKPDCITCVVQTAADNQKRIVERNKDERQGSCAPDDVDASGALCVTSPRKEKKLGLWLFDAKPSCKS